jgi:hypothetical protein
MRAKHGSRFSGKLIRTVAGASRENNKHMLFLTGMAQAYGLSDNGLAVLNNFGATAAPKTVGRHRGVWRATYCGYLDRMVREENCTIWIDQYVKVYFSTVPRGERGRYCPARCSVLGMTVSKFPDDPINMSVIIKPNGRPLPAFSFTVVTGDYLRLADVKYKALHRTNAGAKFWIDFYDSPANTARKNFTSPPKGALEEAEDKANPSGRVQVIPFDILAPDVSTNVGMVGAFLDFRDRFQCKFDNGQYFLMKCDVAIYAMYYTKMMCEARMFKRLRKNLVVMLPWWHTCKIATKKVVGRHFFTFIAPAYAVAYPETITFGETLPHQSFEFLLNELAYAYSQVRYSFLPLYQRADPSDTIIALYQFFEYLLPFVRPSALALPAHNPTVVAWFYLHWVLKQTRTGSKECSKQKILRNREHL